MKRYRDTPRRAAAPRLSMQGWAELTLRVLARDGDRCGWCGKGIRENPDRHHRKRRRDGGDVIENIVILHHACHMEAHNHPFEAKRRGFIVPTYANVIETPLDARGFGWCLLNAEGTRVRTQDPETGWEV